MDKQQQQVTVATDDEQRGINWWNQLPEKARANWLHHARSAVPADAWAAYKKELAKRRSVTLDHLSSLGIDATRDDLERFVDRYPWAAVDSSDWFHLQWFYIVEDAEADARTIISEVFESEDEAWRDAVMKFTNERA
jgi:hypothetical protein